MKHTVSILIPRFSLNYQQFRAKVRVLGQFLSVNFVQLKGGGGSKRGVQEGKKGDMQRWNINKTLHKPKM